jgi:hypothetical protein
MANRPSREVSKHKTRVSLEDSQGRGKLNVSGMEEGYYYHVVNDKNGRVEQLKQRGFEVVQHDGRVSMGDSADKQVGSVVKTVTDSKDGTKGVLMRIPQEFKDEDDAFRQKQIDKSEEALFRNAKDEKGRYGDIKVE